MPRLTRHTRFNRFSNSEKRILLYVDRHRINTFTFVLALHIFAEPLPHIEEVCQSGKNFVHMEANICSSTNILSCKHYFISTLFHTNIIFGKASLYLTIWIHVPHTAPPKRPYMIYRQFSITHFPLLLFFIDFPMGS